MRSRDERDLLIPAFGLHLRASVAPEELLSALASEGWPTYVIEGAPTTKAEFHEAVRASLPQDPPLLGPTPNWDALNDSLSGGLYELRSDKVAIVWPGSSRLAETDPDAYRVAKEILTDIVFGLADPKFSPDHVTRVLVLLG